MALDLNRQTGSVHSLITDIACGTVLVDSTILHPGWTPGFDNFDSVLFASSEASATLPWGPDSTTGCAGMVASAATMPNNFEGCALGSFPAAQWLDAAVPFPVPSPSVNAPLPSATVVATTNAFGAATQALQTVDALGVSKGISAPVPFSSSHSLAADIRTLRFAETDTDTSAGAASGWTTQLTFAKTDVTNFAVAPQAGLYASSLTRSRRLFLFGSNGGPLDDFDLGAAAALNTWYTVSLNLGAPTGNFHSVHHRHPERRGAGSRNPRPHRLAAAVRSL